MSNPKSKDEKNKDVSRRNFVGLATAGVLGLAAVGTAVGTGVFIRPRVNAGAPTKFKAGKPDTYSSNSFVTFAEQRVIVRRQGSRFSAVSTVCTHLGCTVNYTGTGFKCPCHGSQYDEAGMVVGGPAPKALSWFKVSIAPNGEIEVDKKQIVEANTFLEV